MSKPEQEKSLVRDPLFSMRLGEFKWDINSAGCVGIVVLALVVGACAAPRICEVLFKAVDFFSQA